MCEPGCVAGPTLDDYATALGSAVEAALPRWVERSVERILVAYRGAITDDERAEARRAGDAATTETMPALHRLLTTDVDEQRTNPLALLRGAVRYPTRVLQAAGVPPVVRDEFAERAFPADLYDLTPATWADVDPALHEPGLTWSAAKAHMVLARRRAEGMR
jgi:hypothetical protein